MGELYVFFGLIASGKSTLAEAFAVRRGLPYYNTDRVRKELAGIAPSERRAEGHGEGIYSREFTERTYQAMLDAAGVALREGRGVVLDGSYSTPRERERVLACARQSGAAAVRFIICHCSERETRRRLELRARDPLAVSDGRWEIYCQQKKTFQPPDELAAGCLIELNTEERLENLLASLEERLAG